MNTRRTADYEQLGSRLRLAREQARLTQTDAAQSLGISSAALSQYESGKRRVDALMLERLARLYAVPIGYLFDLDVQRPDWEETLRLRSDGLSPAGKVGIGRLIELVRDFEELYRRTETAMPGRQFHPFAPLPSRWFTDEEVAVLADRARRHFVVGLAPLPELREFLEAEGFNTFSVPLGGSPDDLSGLFFVHPQLGPIVSVNTDQNHRRRPFTLAHELAHALFHYDRAAILCRSATRDPDERFADRFAAYFLVPREALADWLHDRRIAHIDSPEQVVHLARYFGISFKAMVRRLREADALSVPEEDLVEVRPSLLAKKLRYWVPPYELDPRVPLPLEERLPTMFVSLAYKAVDEGRLSLRRAAEMLGVSDIELEERLCPTPQDDEEFVVEPEETYAF